MKIRSVFLTVLLLTAGRAFADDLTMNLDASTLTVSPGGQVTFTGTITNNDASILDLNSISVTLGGQFGVDTTPFFSGPLTVAANGSTIDFPLFTVTANSPYTDPLGPQTGTVTILGGVESPAVGYDPTAENQLGSTGFAVDVIAPAPEISPGWMVLTAGGLLLVWRRFGKARDQAAR